MENNLILTDDELSLIATSLMITISSYDKQVELHGTSSLTPAASEALVELKVLQAKLHEDFFRPIH